MSTVSTFTPRFRSAPEYVLALDEPQDNVAVLVRNRGRRQTMQRILPAEAFARLLVQMQPTNEVSQ